jgi:hypothetical protein
MGSDMIALVAGVAVCLGIAEVGGMLWDAIWRFF